MDFEMRPLFMIMLFLFVAPFAGVCAIGTAWIADREMPVVSDKYWVRPEKVRACETMQFYVSRVALKQAAAKIYFTLRDQDKRTVTLELPESPELRGALGPDTFSIPVQVPCSFKAGWGEIEHRFLFRRNPTQYEALWPLQLPTGHVKFCVTSDADPEGAACSKEG